MSNKSISAQAVFPDFGEQNSMYFFSDNSVSTWQTEKKKKWVGLLLWSIHLTNIKAPAVMVLEK